MNRSRRRSRLLLTLLLLTSFTLITLDYRSGSGNPFGFLRSAASSVFGPLERAATAIARPVGDVVSSLGHLGRDKKRIDNLERENQALQERLRLGELNQARSAELAKMDALAGRGGFTRVAARVIGFGGGLGFASTATIDVGSRDGIKAKMTVINGDGLVGRIETVGRTSATLLLANDRKFTVFSRLVPSLEQGPVTGQGPNRPLTFSLLSQTASLKVGQNLVTVGTAGGSFFVPEVPVGVVSRVRQTPGALTRTADVRSFVNFSSLDIVGVITKAPRTLPRNALLPPSPTPSPTRTPVTPVSPLPSGSASPSPGATASPRKS
ncbi:MAG: rod shape-determining protein MreC [Frankiales bacterium]|nr:rod shape-determining protein MreC [Frankiales bacterium]